MRIKSCSIKAFGKILNKDFTFDKGINCFVQNNGNGKTTLADFIRVMLYGMKTSKASDASMGDRRRYLPYEGEKLYGGSMTVVVGDEEIVIKRTFDSKSSKQDTLTINGIEETESEQTIGERYFNIDEDAFRRTVYVSSLTNDSESVYATDSINRNMDMMVTDISTVNLNEVLASFDKSCSEILTSNRTKKNRGEINMLDEEAETLNGKLSELRNIDEYLAVKYAELNRLKDEQDKLSVILNATRKRTHELKIWKQIDDYNTSISSGKEALEQLNQRYPKGLVSATDIQSMSDAYTSIVKAESALIAMRESEETISAFHTLEKRFSSGFDANEYEHFKALKKNADEEAIRIDMEAKTRLQGEELTSKFAAGIPSDEQMETSKAKALKFKDNEVALQALATMPLQPKIPMSGIIAGIMGVVVGIILLTMDMMAVGIAVAILSVVAVIIALILSRHNGNHAAQLRAVELNEENSRLERELKRFYAPWGFYDTAFLEYADSLNGKVAEYKSYLEAKVKRDNDLNNRRLKINNDIEEIQKYLNRYGTSELAKVESDYLSYREQSEQRAAMQQKRNEYDEIKNRNRDILQSLLDKYGLALTENIKANIEQFKADLSDWNTISITTQEIEKTINKLREDNGLTIRPAEMAEGEDEASVQKKYEDKLREVSKLSDDIMNDEEMVKKIDEYEAMLSEIAERKEFLSARLSLLQKTKGFIESANNTLKDRFVGPVRNKYGSYMRQLLPRWADDIEMDTDYRVRVKVDGIAHDCNHLSQGERTCLELALRIAVIDNMYKEEKPFIVMDDPFVELDAVNMVKAKELIRKIAERYQVVYFCCHESRRVFLP